jgi:hypothetical protein
MLVTAMSSGKREKVMNLPKLETGAFEDRLKMIVQNEVLVNLRSRCLQYSYLSLKPCGAPTESNSRVETKDPSNKTTGMLNMSTTAWRYWR